MYLEPTMNLTRDDDDDDDADESNSNMDYMAQNLEPCWVKIEPCVSVMLMVAG